VSASKFAPRARRSPYGFSLVLQLDSEREHTAEHIADITHESRPTGAPTT